MQRVVAWESRHWIQIRTIRIRAEKGHMGWLGGSAGGGQRLTIGDAYGDRINRRPGLISQAAWSVRMTRNSSPLVSDDRYVCCSASLGSALDMPNPFRRSSPTAVNGKANSVAPSFELI